MNSETLTDEIVTVQFTREALKFLVESYNNAGAENGYGYVVTLEFKDLGNGEMALWPSLRSKVTNG